MTVQEYVEAGICVCWDGCVCTAVCARNADVVCQCVYKHEIEVEEDN